MIEDQSTVRLSTEVRAYLSENSQCSTAAVALRLGIEWSVANRILESLEEEGYVSCPNWLGRRKVLHGRELAPPSLVPLAAWVEEQAHSLHDVYRTTLLEIKDAFSDYKLEEQRDHIQDFHDFFMAALVSISGADTSVTSQEAQIMNIVLEEEMTLEEYEQIRLDYAKVDDKIEMISGVLCDSLVALSFSERYESSYDPAQDCIISLLSCTGQLLIGADEAISRDEVRVLAELVDPLRKAAAARRVKIAPSSEDDVGTERNSAISRSDDKPIKPDQNQDEDPVSTLYRLTGLAEVKREVETLISLARVFNLRREHGLPVPDMSFHLVFAGSPGTGKTTVARIIAKIYGQLNLISRGHLIETDRAGLVGGYIGQTAIKTKEVIDTAIGGVLFIDEAYSLNAKSEDDYGPEAVETILKSMEDNRDNLVVIVAGYTAQMKDFIQSNPGLQSRFSRTIEFSDYSKSEMLEIYQGMIGEAGYRLGDGTLPLLTDLMADLVENRDSSFANARDARKLFQRTVEAQAGRISFQNDISESDLITITKDDLPSAERFKPDLTSMNPVEQIQPRSLDFKDRLRSLLQELANYRQIRA